MGAGYDASNLGVSGATTQCPDPDAFLDLPIACAESSMYDNITAGVFDCEATLDSDIGDDYYHEDDSGW